MANLHEFIAARRAELKLSLSSLDERRAEIVAELDELEAAEAAARQVSTPLPSEDLTAAASIGERANNAPPIRRGSIKEKVMSVLSACPEGADANKILELIEIKFGEIIPRSSLSPQLSRLKGEGRLLLNGSAWSLRSDKETPGAGAPGVLTAGGVGAPLKESRNDQSLFD